VPLVSDVQNFIHLQKCGSLVVFMKIRKFRSHTTKPKFFYLQWLKLGERRGTSEDTMTMTFKKSFGKTLKRKKKVHQKKQSRDLREDRGTRQTKLSETKNKPRR